MATFPQKRPKLRQIHPKSRKFESCHLTRMQPVWIFPEPATPAGSFLLQNRRFWNLRRYPVKYSQNSNRQPDQRAKKMSRDQPRLKSRIRFITMNCSE